MVFIVTAENRTLFDEELVQMHRQRKSVFVDGLRWPLAVTEDLEVDEYDGREALYLLITDRHDQDLIASARLLRTDRPHPLGSLFPRLCAGSVPQGPAVWEASRFCPSPLIRTRAARLALLWHIICGILETALLFDIGHITLIANRGLLPCVLDCGWDSVRLGPTLPDGDNEMTALLVHANRDGLRRVRSRYGVATPITRFYAAPVTIAA